jgi:hypothetical protein
MTRSSSFRLGVAAYLAEFEEMWAGHAEWQRLWSALGRDRSETRFLGVSQAK